MKTMCAATPSDEPEVEKLMTKRQLAKYLGKSERTIDHWRQKFGLPCLKIGHSVFFRLSDVLRHIETLNGKAGLSPIFAVHQFSAQLRSAAI